jgi:hypothetical protein
MTDEEFESLLKQRQKLQEQQAMLVRGMSQLLLDCRDRMKQNGQHLDLVSRIDAQGLYRVQDEGEL